MFLYDVDCSVGYLLSEFPNILAICCVSSPKNVNVIRLFIDSVFFGVILVHHKVVFLIFPMDLFIWHWRIQTKIH